MPDFPTVTLALADWERLQQIAHFTFTAQDERILNTIKAVTELAEKQHCAVEGDILGRGDDNSGGK